MSYWYPSQLRVDEITLELAQLERASGEQISDYRSYLPFISKTLELASRLEGFPRNQIGQWVWLASQFRLLAAANEPGARRAGAALIFLSKLVEQNRLSASSLQDLNWVLDWTVRNLNGSFKSITTRSCLSADELLKIETRLLQFATARDFDEHDVRGRIDRQHGELAALSASSQLFGVAEKVEVLFEAVKRNDKEGAAARSALLYLADQDDVVPDDVGVLGLVDDAYVIDWAYSVVEKQTRCLPLLQALLEDWPFVADLAIVGDAVMPLDRFGQYVSTAVLYSLFTDEKDTLLVLRDTAGFGAIAAFFVGVQCARAQANYVGKEITSWPIGQNVVIGDGERQFKAIFQGIEQLGSRAKYRLGVRQSANMTVDVSLAPYIARAAGQHKILCSGTELSSWLKSRHLDPMVTLTGVGKRRFEKHPCVLFLGPKHKLYSYLPCIKPFGMSVSALLGVKYVGGDLSYHDFDGQPSDTPLIYACSDPAIALDLIETPPEHVSEWKIVVDGAKLGRSLRDSLSALGEIKRSQLCVLGELSEREAAADLMRVGVGVWYLEDQDVDPAPLTSSTNNGDPLLRSLRRQGVHWLKSMKVSEAHCSFLEQAATWLSSAEINPDDRSLQALQYAVSFFIKKATGQPIKTVETTRQLTDAARNIMSQASTLAIYDRQAAELLTIFDQWNGGATPGIDKEAELLELALSIQEFESVAIVCRSEKVAKICADSFSKNPAFKRIAWMNLEEARLGAPYDRIIVPTWLDKFGMRELTQSGYCLKLDIILYPFEYKWLQASINAGGKWERRLERTTVKSLQRIPVFAKIAAGTSLWRDPTTERMTEVIPSYVETIPENDIPEFEEMEARAIAALQQSIAVQDERQAITSARLVLFEREEYVFLPPAGTVIVLAAIDQPIPESGLNAIDAERMLFRKVASLRPGMVLAFSAGGDRDLLDARADQFIPDAAVIRATASLWKAALRRHLTETEETHGQFSIRLAAAGEKRDVTTVRSWATNSNSIAPRNYRVLVPLIGKLTNDAHLISQMSKVLQCIDVVYRARAAAAEAIVRDLLSGEIDTSAEELTFELNGKHVRYNLRKVQALGNLQDVPVDQIGRIGSLFDVAGAKQTEHVAEFHQ